MGQLYFELSLHLFQEDLQSSARLHKGKGIPGLAVGHRNGTSRDNKLPETHKATVAPDQRGILA